MNTAKPVTVWLIWTPPEKSKAGKTGKPGYWSFNHIEDGHSEAEKPHDAFNRGWSRGQWRQAHGHLGALGAWGSPKLEYTRDGLFDVAA